MTPKEEAEKNWAIYDRLAGIEDSNPSSISYASREAYKAALRAEIEEMKKYRWVGHEFVFAMNEVLERLDIVTPKQ